MDTPHGTEGPGEPRRPADELLDEALVPSQGARERLLSFLVHELRNPIASALWSAEMLARNASGDPRHDRLTRLGMRSMRRLRALLEDMFSLERVPPAAPQGQTDLVQAIEEASAHREDLPGAEVEVEPGPAQVLVALDPVLVDKLVRACLRRSALAGEGGTASVGLVVIGKEARLTVRRADIPPERLDPPPLTPGGSEGGGTTFSLLLARALARTLHVPLEVRGDGAGGSVIELRFPVA